MEENKRLSLPENAGRPLKPGEKYQPLLKADKNYREVTPYSVGMGLLMTIIFSAAAAYLGQNVIIQSIGACSGVIVPAASINPAIKVVRIFIMI